MSSGEQITIVLVALYCVKELIAWLFSFTRGQQKQEQTDSEERGRWMSMMEILLDKQQVKFVELANIFKDGLKQTVLELQKSFADTLEQTLARMDERMTPVTTERIAKQNLMHEDIKSVPAETIRLLGQEEHRVVIVDAVSAALKPVVTPIVEKLDHIPGDEESRKVIREEIQVIQQQIVDKVAAQIAPLLEKLEGIGATLDKLQPPAETKESGEQTLTDVSTKGENNYVGNPS